VSRIISLSDAGTRHADGDYSSRLNEEVGITNAEQESTLHRADTKGTGVPALLRNGISICGPTRTHGDTDSIQEASIHHDARHPESIVREPGDACHTKMAKR
jgi:hypothetical protein